METERSDAQGTRLEVGWIGVQDRLAEKLQLFKVGAKPYRVYGVPKNGMILTAFLPPGFEAATSCQFANIILDDIIDSGRTRARYKEQYPTIPFVALYDKTKEFKGKWLVMPWEDEGKDAEDLVIRQLEMIGEVVGRQGLKETPARVVRSWQELYGGYGEDPRQYCSAVFEVERGDEMIILKDIEFYSTCEHHMLPFYGKAHVGYVPKGNKVIGVSKIARIIDVFARRLQIQERLTRQVAGLLANALNPQGVGVVMEARHLCMMARGVEKQNSIMTTSAVYGSFRDEAAARAEFMNRIS